MGFPFLTIFLLFLIWLFFRYRKIAHMRQEENDAFWSREAEANMTPAKDINNLDYITIPLEKFPLKFAKDDNILALETELEQLAEKRILNLNGKTNTDLKLEYGLPNFDAMVEIGENFDKLCLCLDKYGAALIENEMINEAVTVLEFAVGCGSDISSTYMNLFNCYVTQNNSMRIDALRTMVENSTMLLKPKILEYFSSMTDADGGADSSAKAPIENIEV